MLYGVLPRPDARLLPQVLSPHPAPHPGPRTRPRASAPAPRLALWFSRSGPRIRSSQSCLRTPASALLPPHSCLRTPASAPRPALRSRVPGGALRSRAPTQTCPHILPRALGGGFEGRILEGGFRVPGSSSGPRVLALCSGPHNPVLAPRLLAFRPASASHFDPRTPAPAPGLALRPPHPGSHSGSLALVLASGPRTPVSALLPPHPGPHSGPVFRAVHSGLALRPRPAPTFCPALWVADLKGGFWKEAFAFRAQAPVPAFWPCVPALTTRSSRPGSSHSALRRPRTSTHAPRLALRSRVPGGALRSRAPVPCSGRRTPVPCSDPDLPPTFCPTLWAADSGGGSCPRAPSRISFRVPALAPRLLHSRPAFRAAVLKGGFRATFWNVAFRAAVLKEGGYAAVPV